MSGSQVHTPAQSSPQIPDPQREEVVWYRKQKCFGRQEHPSPRRKQTLKTGAGYMKLHQTDKGQEIPGQSSGPIADCLSRFSMAQARSCSHYHCRMDSVPSAMSSETTGFVSTEKFITRLTKADESV